MHRNTALTLCVVVALGAAACKKDNPGGGDPEVSPTPTPPVQDTAQSEKAELRFKGDLRITRDFSSALGLDESELCAELGQYSCTGNVHKVALGGVDPYVGGVYERNYDSGVTAPLIVERVALAGCAQRVEEDFADPTGALIFRNLDLDGNGALVEPGALEVDQAITTLTRRAWLRDPRGNEIQHMRTLYLQIEAAGETEPARQWAVSACMVVLTSMETLFY